MSLNLRTGPAVAAILALLSMAAGVQAQVYDWQQQAYVKSMDSQPAGRFGLTLAMSGDTIVVGAPFEDNGPTQADCGAAYVYVRTGTTWAFQAVLRPSNPDPNDRFGASVGISGDTIVVGAPGEASNGTDPFNNGSASSGAAYIFVRSGTSWGQSAWLKAQAPQALTAGDRFGEAVAIDGTTVVVAAPFRSSLSGMTYVFVSAAGSWSQQATLTPLSVESGQLAGGGGVAISGDFVAVGAPLSDQGAVDNGRVYLYLRTGTSWASGSQQLGPPANSVGQSYGSSVALSGTTLVVGSPYTDLNALVDNGAAFVYTRPLATWTYQATLSVAAVNSDTDDHFGTSVAIENDEIVVGASDEDSATAANPANDAAADSGAVYVFTRVTTTWSQEDYVKAGTLEAGDHFGSAVAIHGNWIVAGAPDEDSAAFGVGGSATDNSATSAGSCCVFARPVAPPIPAPQQYDYEGLLIPEAGATHGGFVARSAVSHPDGYDVRLQVEILLVPTGYGAGTLFTSTPVASGSAASVVVGGIGPTALPAGSYHWQARTRGPYSDSPWVSVGIAIEPNGVDIVESPNVAPTSGPADQVQSGGAILIGGVGVDSEPVIIRAVGSDLNNDHVHLEVEARPVGVAFSDTATHSGPPANSGQVASCPITNVPGGAYHWQSRMVDPAGAVSAWVKFGANSESATDFNLGPDGSRSPMKSCLGSAPAAGAPWPAAILLLLALRRR